MKSKDFLLLFKDPYVLFPLYLLKSILYSFGMVDFGVLAVIAFFALFEKFLGKAKESVDTYFDIKKSVLSENEFRLQVNKDMSELMTQVQGIKMVVNNPFDKIGKR